MWYDSGVSKTRLGSRRTYKVGEMPNRTAGAEQLGHKKLRKKEV